VTTSFAASSALAKQIEQGAPADVFISADLQWMDYLGERKLIKSDTRVNLLGNKLVLIASADSRLTNVTIGDGFDIAKLAGDGRIAVADTKSVPAGLYAKAALEKLGAWKTAEPKLARAENVRATLAFVARGETPIGIVYETDAKVEPKVKVIGTFPDTSHPPIIYPVAATAESKKAGVAQYLDFLRTPASKAIFEKYGFSYLIKASPLGG
jgi:molybdate transport system substrate-binding protein